MKIGLTFLLAVLLALSTSAFAQDTRGKIGGRIVDSSGAIVPAVEVKASNAQTGVVTSGTSNAQGNFSIPYLAPGIYSLSAELAGFKKYVRDSIELRVEDDLSIDITLEAGAVTESVTVKAETPLL